MHSNYEIKLLRSSETQHFNNMTYGQYKPFLAWMDVINDRLFPIGLYRAGRPAGLLLGLNQLNTPGKADIMSIFIEKEFRRRGLALKMIDFFEQQCRESKIKTISTFYFDNRPFVTIINNLLDKCGFLPAEPELYYCKCDKSIADMPITEYTKLPDGFETFSWTDIPSAEKKQLMGELEGQGFFDQRISPFINEKVIVPEISLGLKAGKNIIGWAICSYYDENTICYNSIFIMPQYQGAALGIALQMRSIRGHLLTELSQKYPYAIFMVRYDNHARLKMVKKKFSKYSIEQYNQVIRKKILF
ncbi:MAG: GNAT family N-acetyltransferase [Candidatus Wallbacteria bacterium]